MNDDPDSPSLNVPSVNVIVRLEDEAWLDDLPDAQALSIDAAVAALLRAPASPPAGPAAAAGLEVGLVLTSDQAVRALNRDYRGQDKPTNVLAFEADTPAGPHPDIPAALALPLMLGDVVLARETLLREARDQGKAPADHLCHLVVHGVLHLLGYDHEDVVDAAWMEAAEVAILEGLGVADPYVSAGDCSGVLR